MSKKQTRNYNIKIFALSDATGHLAKRFAETAMRQFPTHDFTVVRSPQVTKLSMIEKYVKLAKKEMGVVVFTFVSSKMRDKLIALGKEHQVVVIDILGPILGALSNFFHENPIPEPGQQYKLTQNYFNRAEAIEFTVKHDDGLGLDTIHQADIVILGVSRTSKTPLSIFLANQGFRCANIPLIHGIPEPEVIHSLDSKRMTGLTISPQKLMEIRNERLKKLGQDRKKDYASIANIKQELTEAKALFRKLKINVIDVTNKAIEETASEVITRYL